MEAAGGTFWVRQAAAGCEGPGWLAIGPREQSDAPQVRLTWSDGLDLDFLKASSASAGALGTLRRAAFRGDVVAETQDTTLTCNEHLVLDLETDASGTTTPTLLAVSGNVRASDPDQPMWADDMRATFLKPDDRSPHTRPADTAPPLPVPAIRLRTRVHAATAPAK